MSSVYLSTLSALLKASTQATVAKSSPVDTPVSTLLLYWMFVNQTISDGEDAVFVMLTKRFQQSGVRWISQTFQIAVENLQMRCWHNAALMSLQSQLQTCRNPQSPTDTSSPQCNRSWRLRQVKVGHISNATSPFCRCRFNRSCDLHTALVDSWRRSSQCVLNHKICLEALSHKLGWDR